MSLISVNNLTFYYDGSSDNIFEDVSFRIDTDWKLGFAARNGRGKTTFLNLLMGKYEYQGTISTKEPFDYFPFEVTDMSQNTVDVLAAVYPDYEFWKVCRELSLLQVSEEVLFRPFSTLSNGEQTKAMLAMLFSMDHHFLLLDEPTNHLDMVTREVLRDYLKTKKGYILVSHDRDLLDACTDHTLVINKTNIEVCQGNFSTSWENKKRQDAYETAENERLKKDIHRLKAAARQAHDWADEVESTKIGKKSEKYEKSIDTRAYVGEKSRRMQMRRKNLERRQTREIEEKEGLLKNVESAEDLKLFPLRHYKPVLASLEEVQISYKGKTLPPMSFQIENGDRVVLRGKNGCGKSSILKLLLRELQEGADGSAGSSIQDGTSGQDGINAGGTGKADFNYTGKLKLASGLKVSYVAQETRFLQGSLKAFAKDRNLDETLFFTLLRKLDFSREQFEKRMEDYSGGQKKKVLLAASLCEQAHLYIWDEPLNFIDIFSRMQLEELICKFKPTMLFVEHDKAFVDKTATKVIDYKEEETRPEGSTGICPEKR
ncbi:MAG: ATP-binding cassette domain-containing protein [Lachnospiraceae bacterium]|nr:ATP-binding cassette domain-containing protein [Lachnospiraceae bacterium]